MGTDTTDKLMGAITFKMGASEMLRIEKDRFVVRGVSIGSEHEAEKVYGAFRQWLTWALLQQH